MSLWKKNLLLLTAVVIIAVIPLVTLRGAGFSGADSQAADVVAELAPDYQPWFTPLVELPGSEIESLMFAMQAALGAGVVGFVLGRITAKGRRVNPDED